MSTDPTAAAIGADEFAFTFMFDLDSYDNQRPRTQQSLNGELGASDLGWCREQVRRKLVRETPSDTPTKWAALVGTYMDEGVKKARQAARPWLQHDLRLPVRLPSGFTMTVSLDELDPREPSYTDVKTKDGLADARSHQSSVESRFQRHVCYYAAYQNGLVPADGLVRNIYLDRSGKDDQPHVEQEPFDMEVVRAADGWLEDAIYAAEHGEEAMKEQPRPICSRFCEFNTRCRGGEDPVVEELLRGDRAAQLARLVTAKEMVDRYKPVYDELRGELKGTTGRSESHYIRSTVQNGKTASVRIDVGRLDNDEKGAA